MKKLSLLIVLLCAIPLVLSACAAAQTATSAPAAATGGGQVVSYSRDIQPIFDQRCTGCHGGSGGLTLSSYESLMAGGKSGSVVVAGKPDSSELYLRITGQKKPVMPKSGPPLSDDQIELIKVWIQNGALNK